MPSVIDIEEERTRTKYRALWYRLRLTARLPLQISHSRTTACLTAFFVLLCDRNRFCVWELSFLP